MREVLIFCEVKWKKNYQGDEGLEATGDEDVPGDVLKVLGEDDLRIMRRHVNNIYETKEWPKLQ